jgi:hypothetical protein
MILIEGIPVLAARLIAEQKAKEWLAKSRTQTLQEGRLRPTVERASARHAGNRAGIRPPSDTAGDGMAS